MGKNPKHRKSSELPKDHAKLGKSKLAKTNAQNTKKCSVKGCGKLSIHSLALNEYETALKKAELEVETIKGARRFTICKEHYKMIKSSKKQEDKKVKTKYNKGDQQKQYTRKAYVRLD